MPDPDRIQRAIEEAKQTGVLYLRGNKLPSLPPEIWELRSLTTLNLPNNQLTSLPAEIGELTSLTTLDLSNNQLTSVPAEIGKLTSLTELRLYINQLTSLPAEIGELTSLTTLDLPNNQLTSLPAEIGELTSLTTLDLSNNQLTSVPAEIGKLTSLTELRLYINQLTSLPAEIGELTSLTTLDLSNNQLTSVPAEIGKLTSLTELDLGGNQLTELPPEIGKLTSLTKLDLAANQLKSLPAEIGKLTNLTKLNLGAHFALSTFGRDEVYNNNLTELPGEIGELRKLTRLTLSNNQLTSLPAEIWKLTTLTQLYLAEIQLTSLPAEIGELSRLTTLDLSGNQLTRLPAEIGKLTNLTELNLGAHHGCQKWNQLTELPGEIGELKSLTELHLNGNQLTSLPAEIGKLSNLNWLDLSSNQLTSLPAEIGKLSNLPTLHLNGNQLTSLPAEIGKLTSLPTLDLSYNQLTSLPEEIGELTSLTKLDLAANQLKSLPAEIGKLTNLTKLDLSSNQLTSLPEEIGKLSNLNWLYLSSNQLTSLPAEIGKLSNLPTLHLNGNQLTSLPAEIGELTSLTHLGLSSNPLTKFSRELLRLPKLKHLALYANPIEDCPTEILGEHAHDDCLAAVHAHFSDTRQGSEQDRDLKMIVLGNGRVGKTCVLKRLIDDTFDPYEKSTHGISLFPWQLEVTDGPLRVNVWDFGGQDIYHGTHALFLKHRAVFLIVWDRETEGTPRYEEDGLFYENFSLQYWLDYVRAVSPGSSVVVVENKCDDARGSTPHTADIGGLPHITFSAQEGHGRETLIATLRDTVGRELTAKGSLEIGVGRLNVKEKLRGYMTEEGKPVERQHRTISYEHFQELCDAEGEKVSSPIELLRFLHNTGFLFYQPNLFHNQIILDQRWVIDAIYTIYHRQSCCRQLHRRGGRFTPSDLHDLAWSDRFSAEEQQLFITFMESCSICFRVSDWNVEEPEYIAPELLPERSQLQDNIDLRLRAVDSADGVHYCYRHKFLHQGIMQRFTVHVGSMFRDAVIYWQNGLLLDPFDGGAVAIVECRRPTGGENPADGEITIHVRGSRREELLNQLRNEFDRLNESQADTPQFVSVDAEDWVAVAKLSDAELVGQVVSEGRQQLDVQPYRFLLRLDPEARLNDPSRQQPPTAKTPIYISYAWGDVRKTGSDGIVDRLYQSLTDDRYDVRRDNMDLGYKDVISEFMKELGRGACIIAVISDKYLRSPFCMFELLEIHRNLNFHKRLCPIVLSDARIHTLAERLQYVAHWKMEFDKIDKLVKQVGIEVLSAEGSLSEYKKYQEITLHADTLLSFLADINALSPAIIAANDFEALKQAIDESLSQLKE